MKIPAILISTFLFFLSFLLPFFMPSKALADVGPKSDFYNLESSGYILRKFQDDLQPENAMNLNYWIAGGADRNQSNSAGMATMYFLSAMVAGFPDPVETTPEGINVYNRGAIGEVGDLTAGLINQPPISTAEYIADLGSSLGIAKPAYAQGFGWQVLSPVLGLWKAFRNVAYLVFVLIFVAVGFMIMFRTKIDPQTVITMEAAIPNLIITLVLITFSYAIASLLIDLIYVLIYLTVGIFAMGGAFGDTGEAARQMLLNNGVFQLGFSTGAGWQASFAIGDMVTAALGGGLESIQGGVGGTAPAEQLGKAFASLIGEAFSVLAFLVLAFALLFAMFKLFFQLLLSYVGIIISVIMAPLQILFNALPGSNSFINWLKGLLANILAFPAAAAMFTLAAILTGGTNSTEWNIDPAFAPESTTIGTESWMPPLLHTGVEATQVRALLALGIIMMTPKVVSMIKETLKVEKGMGVAGAIAPIIGVASIPTQAVSGAITYGQLRSYIGGGQPQQPSGAQRGAGAIDKTAPPVSNE